MIFNDKVFDDIVNKDVRDDAQIWVEHGKPMIFGKERNKGLVLNGLKLEVATIGENGITEADILIHDAEDPDNTLHQMLGKLHAPTVMGIIRRVDDATLGDRVKVQMEEVKKNAKFHSVSDLLLSGETWEVK